MNSSQKACAKDLESLGKSTVDYFFIINEDISDKVYDAQEEGLNNTFIILCILIGVLLSVKEIFISRGLTTHDKC